MEETEGKSGRVHRGRKKIKGKYIRFKRREDGNRLGVEFGGEVTFVRLAELIYF